MRERMRLLGVALWPAGFWCERCNHRCDLPWMCEVSVKSEANTGGKSICPECGHEIVMTSKRIRLLLENTVRISAVASVCVVRNVSFEFVLRMPKKGTNPSIRCVMMRELSGLMPDSDIATVFETNVTRVREARKWQPAKRQDLWQKALRQRLKERNKDERQKARKAYEHRVAKARGDEVGAEVAGGAPDRSHAAPTDNAGKS